MYSLFRSPVVTTRAPTQLARVLSRSAIIIFSHHWQEIGMWVTQRTSNFCFHRSWFRPLLGILRPNEESWPISTRLQQLHLLRCIKNWSWINLSRIKQRHI
jgi:hypothetical protein